MPAKDIKKEVRYLNRDFASFRNNLIEYAKVYFPNTYNDFNEASPGMMFIEMASYVGDVLSYYIDQQFKESLLAFAEEKKTVYEIVQSLGYRPKLASPAMATVDFFQTVPAIGSGDSVKPDMDYALTINAGSQVKSQTNNIIFRTLDDVNFKFSSSYDQITTDIFEVDNATNLPTKYLLKKSTKVVSGKMATEYFDFLGATKYSKITLANKNVMDIVSVTDSDGNDWHEVGFLAQDTVFTETENNSSTDPELSQYNDTSPYLLKLKKVARRFTRFINGTDKTELRFGAGISDSPDEELVPNPDNIGSSLPGGVNNFDTAFDPANFLNTKTYGQAPQNTTLTVIYSYGGSTDDNVAQGEVRNISDISYTIDDSALDSAVVGATKNSVAVTNVVPATGGQSSESLREMKENSLAYFQAQQRAVTKEDYITRIYSMPPKYGNIAKAYMVQDEQLEASTDAVMEKVKGGNVNKSGVLEKPLSKDQEELLAKKSATATRISNPLALNAYVLGYDSTKRLVRLNQAVKENIQTHLGQYRMVTDAINIKDAWVINIGVTFNILTARGFNKHEVVLKCIEKIKGFFDIDKWQINQPIIVADLVYQLSLVDGIAATVPPKENNPNGLPILITNKWKMANGYSGNIYDINEGTKNGVIYPSVDPSIFELKYPNSDILGKADGDI